MADLEAMNIIIGANVSNAQKGLNDVSNSLGKTAIAAQKVDSSIAKTTTNFTGLSRVIQDLPFGFTAISNNLTQILPAAGALGLAFSALVSGLTFLQVGFSAWTRGIKDNKEALEENKKAQEALYNDAGKEIGRLITLTNAAKDTKLATEERLAAVKLLQKEYPSYFKNLSQEQILNGNVANAVNRTTEALFKRAVVRQKESELGPIAAQLFDLREQRKELEKQEAALKRMAAIAGRGRDRQGIVSSLIGAGSQDRAAIGDVQKQISALDKLIGPLQGKFKGLAQAILDAGDEAGKGLFSEQTKEKLKDDVEEISTFFLADTNIKNIAEKYIDAIAVETGDNINKIIEKSADGIEPGVTVLTKKFGNLFAEGVSDILNGTLKNAIVESFVSISDAIASGKNPLQGLFDVLGGALKAMGKEMIRLSPLIASIKIAIKTLNPAILLPAGIALVALGSALQNAIPKFATGGVVTRPTLALVGEQGPERITPLGQINNSSNVMAGEVVFQINGNTLRGVLRRADQSAYNTL